jgi:hypothetical protein
LADRASKVGLTEDCLNEKTLVEALEGTIAQPSLEGMKSHFAGCATCRGRFAEMSLVYGETGPLTEAVGEPLEPGASVGRYRILDCVGSGAMGTVYSAHDPDLDRRVALKLVRRTASTATVESARGRLLREAQAMARLHHSNVVTVYDVGVFAEQVFIAMELVDGEALSSWLRQVRPWREVLEVFLQAGRGLAAAHAAGLVHRDFKPDNVLVGKDGHVRVTDFGLARLQAARDPELLDSALRTALSRLENAGPASECDRIQLGTSITRSGTWVGTPAYMAPEQMGGGVVDARTDVFSFCVALYEGLYRERPFVGDNIVALRAAVATNRVRAAPASDVPPRLREVLLRGLRAAPAERYPTMLELLSAITAVDEPPRRRLGVWATVAVATVALGVAAVAVQRMRPAPAPSREVARAVEPTRANADSTPAPPKPVPAKGTLVLHINHDLARVEIDGAVVAAAARTVRVSVDGMVAHLVRVSAPGYRTFEGRITVAANAAVETRIALVRAALHRSPPAVAPAPAPAAAPAPPAAEDPNGVIDAYRSRR